MKSMKQVSFLIVLTAMVLFTSLDSSAQAFYFYDGNRLVQLMREYDKSETRNPSTDYMDVGIYMGYVAGIFDTTKDIFFDPPKNVTVGQICSIVGKYLKENPEKWTLPASVLATEALQKAFPKR